MINRFKRDPVIILDIGNVLVSVDMDAIHKAAVDCGFTDSVHEGFTFMKGIENICNFGLVDMSTGIDMFWGYKRQLIMGPEKYDEAKKNMIETWCSSKCVTLNEEIVEHCYEILLLRHPGIHVVLASNMGIDHYKHIVSLHPFFQDRDLYSIFSFKIGSIKPQQLFFETIDKKVNKITKSSEYIKILYIDDKEENLAAGCECVDDLTTFQFDSKQMKESVFLDAIDDFIECGKLSYE